MIFACTPYGHEGFIGDREVFLGRAAQAVVQGHVLPRLGSFRHTRWMLMSQLMIHDDFQPLSKIQGLGEVKFSSI